MLHIEQAIKYSKAGIYKDSWLRGQKARLNAWFALREYIYKCQRGSDFYKVNKRKRGIFLDCVGNGNWVHKNLPFRVVSGFVIKLQDDVIEPHYNYSKSES